MTSRFDPCRPCCEPCVLFSSGFATSNPLRVLSGTWSLDGGWLKNTASGAAMLRTASMPAWLSFDFEGNTAGQVVTVLLYADTDGDAAVEVRITLGGGGACGTLEVLDGDGVPITAATAIDVWLTAGRTYQLKMCVSTERLLVGVSYSTSKKLSVTTDLTLPPGHGNRVGLKTTIASGSIWFDNVLLSREFERSGPECKDCDPCTSTDAPVLFRAATWTSQPVHETAAQRCHETITTHPVAGRNLVDDVIMKAAVMSAWDRNYGYRVVATTTAPVVQALSLDLCVIWLDDEHRAVFSFNGFLNIKLYRGAILLGQKSNLNYPTQTGGPRQESFEASLQGTRICAGWGRWPAFGAVSITSMIQAETTDTYEGDTIRVSLGDKTFATELVSVDVIRCPRCPGCSSCDESPDSGPMWQNHTDTYQVVLPAFTKGAITCAGGTFVFQYVGNCVWEYRTASDIITLRITDRIDVNVFRCGSQTLPIVAVFRSATLPSPLECNAISGEVITFADDANKTGTVTAL